MFEWKQLRVLLHIREVKTNKDSIASDLLQQCDSSSQVQDEISIDNNIQDNNDTTCNFNRELFRLN